MTTGRPLLRGFVRDRLVRACGREERRPWGPNVVLRGGLDLVGALLCGEEGAAGVSWLAVGAGDPAWDADPPRSDPSRTALTREVHRVALTPGSVELSYDAAGGRVVVRTTLQRGEATGELRELGLVGGRASARLGSGVLVNHRFHDVIVKGEDDVLHRDLVLVLADDLPAHVRDLIGELLARRPGVRGITHAAVGTGGGQATGDDLDEERWRAPLPPGAARYDRRAATVHVRVRVEPGELLGAWPPGEPDDDGRRRPPPVREIGVLGGPADGPVLVARTVVDGPRPDEPVALEHTERLVLGDRTDVVVPRLEGLDLAAARDRLGPDLVLGSVTEEARVGVAGGTIVAQDPAADAVVPELAAVDVVVVTVPVRLVPEVVGLPLSRARTVLRRRDLVPAEEVAERGVGPGGPARGTVVATDPAPGTSVPRESEVRLAVAVPETRTVPRVLGLTRREAEARLRDRGFGAPITWVEQPSGATLGTVVFQTPAPSRTEPIDAALELTVAGPVLVTVPEVVGLDLAEATEKVLAAGRAAVGELGRAVGPPGLAVGPVTAVAAAGEAIGTVVAQRPAGGTATRLYGVVEVDVAVGTTVPVPRVEGLAQADAERAVVAAGLRVGRVTSRAAPQETGTVLTQDPEAGRSLPSGMRVDLVLAVEARVPVPALAGFRVEGAREALAARDLVLGATTQVVAEEAAGTIVGQDPAPGTLVARQSEVAVTLAAGVPAVVGLLVDDAEALLRAVGLSAAVTLVESTAVDRVLAQSPAAGAAAPADLVVRLDVGEAVVVAVPRVVGLAPAAASERLVGAGLVPVTAGTEAATDDAVEVGAVVRQRPEPGTEVQVGSTVAVWLRAEDLVVVPAVLGLPVPEAVDALEALRLIAVVGDPVPSAVVAGGHVAVAMPPPGSRVRRFTKVTLQPAALAEAVVPDVRGLSPDRAVAVLAKAGLEADVDDPWISVLGAEHLPRAVRSQTPGATTAVVAGTVVSLAVGTPLPLPGTHDFEIVSMAMTAIYTQEPDLGQDGEVLRTDPHTGALVRPFETLHVVLASGGGGILLPPFEPGTIVVERPPVRPPVRRPIDPPDPPFRFDRFRTDRFGPSG